VAFPQTQRLLVQVGAHAPRIAGVCERQHSQEASRRATRPRRDLGGEPDSLEILGELRETAQSDPDVLVRELPPDASLQINALQRAATIVLQKSVRESFGLGAAEAMWKGKPVIGGFVGGLPSRSCTTSPGTS